MAIKTSKNEKKQQINIPLITALALVLFIWIAIAIGSKAQKPDPTLTAAPPTIATPGHPLTLMRPSPEKIKAEEDGRAAGR